MGRHAAQRPSGVGPKARTLSVLGVTALTAGLVVGLAPSGFAGAVNSVTVTVTADQSSVTSGNLATYTITLKNTGSKATKPASLANAVTNGTPQSLTQTSGPDSWSCTSATACSLSSGMAYGATDTFKVVAQAGQPGTMTDTATNTVYDYSDGPTVSQGSASTTVTSGSGGGGGGSVTVRGFCPSTGCTISSVPGNPTVSNDTVSRVSFPACQYATAATQSLCNKGFNYSYVLTPAKFCTLSPSGDQSCTGKTVNLGDLTVSTLPQFQDRNHPITVKLIYDASITTGLSDQSGRLLAYKTTAPDGNGGGELLGPCGVNVNQACNAGQTTVSDPIDGDTDLQGEIDMISNDPYVGNTYVI